MAVVKITKSKKAIQFIDENGNSFMTSVISLRNLLNGNIQQGFILLTRMPFKVAADRFKKSPLYTPPGYIPPKDETSTTGDAISVDSRKDNENKKHYNDIKVW